MSHPEPAGLVLLTHALPKPHQAKPVLTPRPGVTLCSDSLGSGRKGKEAEQQSIPQTTFGEEMEGVTFG